MRNLILVLGDQLSLDNPALAGIDRRQDCIVMIEAAGESTHVWSHQARITLFLSAMRHFAEVLRKQDLPLLYVALQTVADTESGLGARLRAIIDEQQPATIIVCEPGEYRVLELVTTACRNAAVPLEIRPDTHFLCSRQEFAAWAEGRKALRMEFFYRDMRRRQNVLMENGEPAGGRWNFDALFLRRPLARHVGQRPRRDARRRPALRAGPLRAGHRVQRQHRLPANHPPHRRQHG